jgi:hypothetical protein
MSKFKLIRYGIKTREGIILIGHSGLPIMDDTREEAKKSLQKGDKVIEITIEEK